MRLQDKFYDEVRRRTRIRDDYTVDIRTADYKAELPSELLSELLAMQSTLEDGDGDTGRRAEGEGERVQPLNIVILIVGTRGDVQPFLPIGQKLKVGGYLSTTG